MLARVCVSITILSVLSVGCGVLTDAKKQVADADLVVQSFVKYRDNANYEDAVGLFSEDAFRAMPKEEILQVIKKVSEKLGKSNATHIVNTQATSHVSGIYSADVILVYQVTCEHGEASETYRLVKKSSGDTFRIVTWNANSNALVLN